jgi:predicted O-methyltransferase YrrM
MNPVLTELLATNTVRLPDGGVVPLHSHIPLFECQLMQQWLREQGCRRLIEIGLAYGISSLFLCDAIADRPDAIYHIIDPHQQRNWQGLGLHHLTQAGYRARVHFHESYAECCLPQLWQDGFRCDFALIDGRHTFDQTLVDFFWINRLLSVNGIVIFDDIQLPAIQRATAYVKNYPCYQPLALPIAIQQATTARVRRLAGVPEARIVGFLKIAEDQRTHDWYVDF